MVCNIILVRPLAGVGWAPTVPSAPPWWAPLIPMQQMVSFRLIAVKQCHRRPCRAPMLAHAAASTGLIARHAHEREQHSATTSTRMNPVKGENGSDDTARSCSVSGGHAGVQQSGDRVRAPPCPPEPAAGARHVVLHLHPCAVTLRVPAPTCAQLSLCVPIIFSCPSSASSPSLSSCPATKHVSFAKPLSPVQICHDTASVLQPAC